jgi:cell division protein FtsZ
MPVELKPRIVVIGVGGAGGNAVNNMIEANLQGVEFVAANTDAQALARSSAPVRLQLGVARTEGLGAGANPETGSEAARESTAEIRDLLQGAHMVFIAAGMGGGTGTGAAPIIASIARDLGALTVGVVTKPFNFEGKRRMAVAEAGIEALRAAVDTLILIPNQNLFRLADKSTTFAQAFKMADQVLYSGVRSITDLMVMPGLINLDFADVKTVMSAMGSAMMGTGEESGDDRAEKAARAAIRNPLLDNVSIRTAKGVLINITGGMDMTLFEVEQAANLVRDEADPDAQIILGSTFDDAMEGRIRVSVVAAGISLAAADEPPAIPVAETRSSPAAAAAPLVAEAPKSPPPQAEAAPSERPPPPVIRPRIQHGAPADQGASSDPPQRSFASLFGWKPRHAQDLPAAQSQAARAVSEDDALDDELEIPAFLRRSAST